MRMSEAMRRGAAMRPQCHSTMFDGVGSCAIGAAIEGADSMASRDFISEWTSILTTLVPSPDSQVPDASQTAWAVVIYLNDERKWAREDIADWLKGIEDKLIAEGKYIPVPIESAPHEIDCAKPIPPAIRK